MRVLAIGVVVALGAAGLALGAQAGLKRFAKASASGDEAIVQAAGTAKHPHAVYVKVIAKPAQKASLAWSMVCATGGGAGSKSGHSAAISAPFTRQLKMPSRNSRNCQVQANSQLSKSGRVTVMLLQR
jgi:hypothetical protein